MQKVNIVDSRGTGQGAKVTLAGALVVATLRYDQTQYLELAEPDVAYNFFEPQDGMQFVITGIHMKADRQVSNTVDADVVLFEAESPESDTVDRVIFQEAMIRGEFLTLRTNILVNEGKFLNATTTDDDIHITVMGYYIEAGVE